MSLCRSPSAPTPLSAFARSLGAQDADTRTPMRFPMYTVPLHAVLQMVEIEPHEELKAKGLVIEFDKNLGNAAFVSHQWLGRDASLRLSRIALQNATHAGVRLDSSN